MRYRSPHRWLAEKLATRHNLTQADMDRLYPGGAATYASPSLGEHVRSGVIPGALLGAVLGGRRGRMLLGAGLGAFGGGAIGTRAWARMAPEDQPQGEDLVGDTGIGLENMTRGLFGGSSSDPNDPNSSLSHIPIVLGTTALGGGLLGGLGGRLLGRRLGRGFLRGAMVGGGLGGGLLALPTIISTGREVGQALPGAFESVGRGISRAATGMGESFSEAARRTVDATSRSYDSAVSNVGRAFDRATNPPTLPPPPETPTP